MEHGNEAPESAPADAVDEDLIRRAMERANFTYQPTKFAQALIDEICDRIKAADDKLMEGDYMLDSNDCISVIRGTWLAARQQESAAAPATPERAEATRKPVLWASPEQVEALTSDPAGEHGHYLPMRRNPAGKFTMPLYTTPERAA